MVQYDPIRSGALEIIGCFALMFFGSFSTKIPKEPENQMNFFLENAIANLLIYMMMMWVASRHSGSQFNPLITVAMVITGNLPINIGLVNVISQIAGSFLGYLVFQLAGNYTGSYLNYNEQSLITVIFLEALIAFMITLTFLLTFCNKHSDRGVYALSVPAVYSVFTLAIGKFYYSRYNILLFFVNSILVFEFHANFIFVLIGGVIGTLLSVFLYKAVLEGEFTKDQIPSSIHTASN